ncbi:unnamed protein product [Victoria cruziana]
MSSSYSLGVSCSCKSFKFLKRITSKLYLSPFFISISMDYQVQEELEKVFKNSGLLLPGRLPEKGFQESEGRKLQLHFKTCLPEKIFTRQRLKGKQGDDIQIRLMDANTGNIISSEPESSLHLEIVVVDGDFDDLPDADWTHEQFERHIVKERKGKGPLVLGQLKVDLANGIAVLGDIKFTDNSRWTRSQKFRLGVRTAAGQSFGSRVREAKSGAFSVKENRGEYYEKHDRPNSNDEVWRLKGIARNGPYHKALTGESISTVEDFVRQLVMNPERLRNIFGSNLRTWDGLVEHARRCIRSKKIYAYYDDAAKKTLVLNNVYEVIGLFENDNYISINSLIGPEKDYLDYMKKKAYRDSMNFKELDEEALFCHVRRVRTIGSNPVTSGTCLPVGQHVEEFSIPSILMDHAKGLPTLMIQRQARQDTQLERSSAAASSSNPPASTAPTDPIVFSESASCSSFSEAQVGIIGSCLPIHGFGQRDFHRAQPPTLGPCLPAVHNAAQHVEEFSNPSIPREHIKPIAVSMPDQQLVQDTQPGQSSALASSHPAASTSPNDAPLLDDSTWDDELFGMLDDNLPDNSCFLYDTPPQADAGFGFWSPFNQHPQKAVTSWLKLRLALRAVMSMRKIATSNRTRLMEQGWGTASHGNCGVFAV